MAVVYKPCFGISMSYYVTLKPHLSVLGVVVNLLKMILAHAQAIRVVMLLIT